MLFIQGLWSWLLILPFALKEGMKGLVSQQLPKILLRTLCGFISLYCISLALETVSLSEVVLLNNTAPLFVPFIVWCWYKTIIPFRLRLGLIVGFIGVFIILRPGFQEVSTGLVVALISGVASALLLVVMRQIAHEPLVRVMFYYFLFFWVGLTPFIFIGWVAPPPIVWSYLFLSALAMIAGQMTFTAALRYASAHDVAPFMYASVIFAGLMDWIVWDVQPSLISVFGMVVVAVGCIITLLVAKEKEEKI